MCQNQPRCFLASRKLPPSQCRPLSPPWIRRSPSMADKDEPMAPTVEPRLQALEQQMAILQQKAVQIDGKMEYLHQQVEHRLWESTDRKHGFRLPIPRKPSLWDFLRPGGSP